MNFIFFFLISLILLKSSLQLEDDRGILFPLLMPNVRPLQKDLYLCTSYRMPLTSHRYIVEFIPNATMATAHHILIFGCKVPGYYQRDTPRAVWDCGEMSEHKHDLEMRPPCEEGNQIIYAWAKDAPKLILPKDVGFKVGGDTGVNFLVLQVHYAKVNKFIHGDFDNSGIFLEIVEGDTNKVSKRAGVLLLGTSGYIPANSYENMEVTCPIQEPLVMHPFAFRTHTHKLGKVVSGWRVRNNTWSLIGHHDPQKPQMFYEVENKSKIIKGDIVAARCTMYNYQNHGVSTGNTGEDEMCNFYLMYYVDGDKILSKNVCFSYGAPFYFWTSDPLLNYHVPKEIDEQASQL